MLIVKGLIKEKSGEIKLPIITNKKENSAVTQYRLLGIFNQNSLFLASPLTGRKHQIRKHFSIIGHPIIGDDKFGTKDSNNFFYILIMLSLRMKRKSDSNYLPQYQIILKI